MAVSKTCLHCGVGFAVPPRRSDSVKFCSRACTFAAKHRKVNCIACGKAYEVNKSLSNAKYCSTACYASTRKGAVHAVKEGAFHHVNSCKVCSKFFRVTATRRDTAKYCSRACLSQCLDFRTNMSDGQSGEKSWRWDGGLYQGRNGYVRTKTKRLTQEIARLQHRQVMEKALVEAEPAHPFLIEIDGVKCLRPDIEVHHIDRVRSNNALSNLLAVTKPAHALIHHKNRKPNPDECWPRNPTKF